MPVEEMLVIGIDDDPHLITFSMTVESHDFAEGARQLEKRDNMELARFLFVQQDEVIGDFNRHELIDDE